MAEPARAAPVPQANIHPATGKRKGVPCALYCRPSAPIGSLGCVVGGPQRLDGIRPALSPRPPGLPLRPVQPTLGALPGAPLPAAPSGPRVSAGVASRPWSDPFEVEARVAGYPSAFHQGRLTELSKRLTSTALSELRERKRERDGMSLRRSSTPHSRCSMARPGHPADLTPALEMFDVVLVGHVSALEDRPVDCRSSLRISCLRRCE